MRHMSEKVPRREAAKKAVYIIPAILKLAAAPSFAKGASGRAGNDVLLQQVNDTAS